MTYCLRDQPWLAGRAFPPQCAGSFQQARQVNKIFPPSHPVLNRLRYVRRVFHICFTVYCYWILMLVSQPNTWNTFKTTTFTSEMILQKYLPKSMLPWGDLSILFSVYPTFWARLFWSSASEYMDARVRESPLSVREVRLEPEVLQSEKIIRD